MKLVRPKKIRIFEYQSFSSHLLLETKSLEIILKDEYFTIQFFSEFKEILDWCEQHTEVKSLYITSHSDFFSRGFDYSEISNLTENEILERFEILFEINSQLKNLPQTTVINFKNLCHNEAISFLMCFDIKISSTEAQFKFSQLENGLIDASGLFTLFENELNRVALKSFIFSGIDFTIKDLNLLGVHVITNINYSDILQNIAQQSCIARIHTKNALSMNAKNKNEKYLENKNFLNSTLAFGEFKREKEFINLRTLNKNYQDFTY